MILAVDRSRMLLGESDGLDARHGCSSRNICCRPHLGPLILLLFSFFRLCLLHYCLRKRRRPQVSLVLKTNRTVAQDLLISGDLLPPLHRKRRPKGQVTAAGAPRWSMRIGRRGGAAAGGRRAPSCAACELSERRRRR